MPAPDLSIATDNDARLLRRSVREAGRIALDAGRRGARHWSKDDSTPVTEADLAVNAYLHDSLAKARPDYGWLSEESADNPERLESAAVWIVDPIDGTRSFIKGTGHWVVSVALVAAGRPLLAAVYNPASEEFFFAERGRGATLNGEPVSVSDRQTVRGCRMVANHAAFKAERWDSPWPRMEVSPRNSMAYRLCLVAKGEHDATFAISSKSDWDLAAADLVVHEAGGSVTSHDGRVLQYNTADPRHQTVLAAGPDLHAALLKKTRTYRRT